MVVAASVLDCQTASSTPSGVIGFKAVACSLNKVLLKTVEGGGGGVGGSQTQLQPPAAVFNTLSFLGSFTP